jgi:hypothetical protein
MNLVLVILVVLLVVGEFSAAMMFSSKWDELLDAIRSRPRSKDPSKIS